MLVTRSLVAAASQQQHRGAGPAVTDLRHQLDAVAIGQVHVDQQHVAGAGGIGQQRARLLERAGQPQLHLRGLLRQHPAGQVGIERVVLDVDQVHGSWPPMLPAAGGNSSTKVAPRPGSARA